MEEVIIIGNSGAARECYQLFMDCWWASPTLRYNCKFKGFLSYNKYSGTLGELSNLALGDMGNYRPTPSDRFIIGIGSTLIREKVYVAMKAQQAVFMNLISPWSYVPSGCVMGEANIVGSNCNLSGNSMIGNGNYFNGNVRLGHDVTIGNFNFFGPSTTVLGGAYVGNSNLFAVGSTLLERSKVGNNNHIYPGSVLFKGCRDNCRMAGNPALAL